jgi:hypothetical protein
MTDLTHRVEAIERHLGMSKNDVDKLLEEYEREGRCRTIADYKEFGDRYARLLQQKDPAPSPTPTRPERSQEYKDAMVAAQKAGIPVQFKMDNDVYWVTSDGWSFDRWHLGDYRIDPTYQQPAKPAQRVARELWLCDGILWETSDEAWTRRHSYAVGAQPPVIHMREVLDP